MTIAAALAMAVGAYRAVALGEQNPARSLLTFGAIVLLTNVAVWADQRRETRRERVKRGDG
jgi:uncharacterized membrane protein